MEAKCGTDIRVKTGAKSEKKQNNKPAIVVETDSVPEVLNDFMFVTFRTQNQ